MFSFKKFTLLNITLCCLGFGFIFPATALAQKSDGNDLCNYLAGLASKNRTDLNATMMSEISNHALDIVTWQNLAIRSKLKFEEFQKLFFEKTNSKMPDSYKGSYLAAYVNFHCGSGKTEAGLSPEKGKPLSSDQYLIFTKEPSAETHPYFKDFKKTR